MINPEKFIKRLKTVMDYYGLSASVFADKIGVQRSGVSHLLSGRNKPSLDFVVKISQVFPEADLYWLLNGQGTFPKDTHEDAPPAPQPTTEKGIEDAGPGILPETKMPVPENKAAGAVNFVNDDGIDRIVVFFKDGTFKSYRQGQ